MDPQGANPELESFREQWRAEVRARNAAPSGSQQQASSSSSHANGSQTTASLPPRPAHLGAGRAKVLETDDDYVQAIAFDEADPQSAARQPERESTDPVTALDHYEHAVEKEGQGSLGDSLRLYRKAFRMDHKVEQKYKNKHHAAAWAKPAQTSKQDTTTKPRDTAQSPTEKKSSQEEKPPSEVKPLTAEELVASFAGLSIEPAAPYIKGMPQPPCPIAELPEEILVHILQDVAMADVSDFVRLSRVCKRFAWLVATEDSIWRQICLGSKFGFAGMHCEFRTSVDWKALAEEHTLQEDQEEVARLRQEEAHATTIALLNMTYHSWQRMFRRRPRIRFNGCYISTINYIRAGQQTNSLAWNSPVHIVTYYRYLRLFRDGTAITLCTVEEPSHVVHHLTKDALALHKGGAMAHMPSSTMQHALRARWRLSSAADFTDEDQEVSLADSEGNMFIESDGGGNYLYRMELSLRTAGKSASNNKLVWRGFYSYNKSADEWDEFTLKDIKPFFFSRVKSYGFAEL
ncbi:F-box domain-containing protein [Diaporthe amygdali]|uniref:F-box domain-containing protein n=1 Tax=Phomopsis amygdali TaxID=1214568 RepID=UPI0022FED1C9|nr:F-box domain-containing protein [Diaporthe amygdali]KAJ0104160.1 F-box domain-containing protein [Diaporthe amygdali]